MEITVSGRHMEITEAIHAYATDKVSKLTRYYDRIPSIEVVIDKGGQVHELEVVVHVERSDPYIVKISGTDVYACLDEAVEKLERKLTDHKEKRRNRKHHSA